MNVFTEPTLEHFEELKKWLKEEDKLYNEGFFCQIHTIEKSFQNRKLIVITDNGLTVGFLTYYYHNYIVNIEIAEVKPDSRGKGFGRLLLNHSFNWFVKNDALVAQLFCSPTSSEKIWKRMGFANFPDEVIRESRVYLYQILVETSELYNLEQETELIELWDFEDYQDEFAPKWKWEVKRKENSTELIKPIIHPCSDEWSVSHKIGKQIREKRIMKNFDMKKHDGLHFLIVKELDKYNY